MTLKIEDALRNLDDSLRLNEEVHASYGARSGLAFERARERLYRLHPGVSALPTQAAESERALAREVERLRAVCAERQSRIDALERAAAATGIPDRALPVVEGVLQPSDSRLYAAGQIVGHSSDGDGPDVGWSVGLGGRMLYVGEISRELFRSNGLHETDLGGDGGSWIVIFHEKSEPGVGPRVLGKAVPGTAESIVHEVVCLLGSGTLAGPIDDESLDGTDGAHPAWWRGNDAGCMAVIGIVEEALAGKPMRGEPGEPRLGAILRGVGQLRAYLRAFVRVCYDERVTRGKEREEAVRAAGLFRINPGMTFNFALNDTDMRDVPLITGGQVLRAMELLGEVDELTPAEEAKNLVASAVLRNLQCYVGLAAQRMAAMSEEDRAKHDMLGVNVHLQNMVTAIGAVAPGKAVAIEEQIADALQEVRDFVAIMDRDPAYADGEQIVQEVNDPYTGHGDAYLVAGTLRAIVRLADLIVPPAGKEA